MTPVWPPGAATGVGPFPGTDPLEAARVILDELGQLPYLPLLPARGVGADPVGRTAALLVDLHVDLVPAGWRLVPKPGRDVQRARTALTADLDAFEEAAEGYEGPLKLQVLGPWTLAANLELPRGHRTLVDLGAVHDLAASLGEGLAAHVADVRRRLGGAGRLLVQLDEPLLGAVLEGSLPTASGWGRLPPVETAVAEEILGRVVAAGGDDVGVRCNAAPAPVSLLQRCGARFFSVDAELLPALPDDELGEALESSMGLLAGLVPLTEPEPDLRHLTEPLRRIWQQLGFSFELLTQAVAVTSTDGLERLTTEGAATILRRCVALGRLLEEVAGEESW